ncbi:unnamed protein product [Durusdinium trenchii]|uniref:Uncharacterized protein n=3 Tax=Durusdinium trenchii TaxID=1381693 RepID=A0ABP0HRA5_9DINO
MKWLQLLFTLMEVVLLYAIRESDFANHSQVVYFDLPRNCDDTGKSTTCCACGQMKEYGLSDEEKEWMHSEWGRLDDMCSRTTDEHQKRICCPLWAIDCKETDPYYLHRWKQECVPEDKECLLTECRDVSERLATAKKMLKVAKMKLQAIPTWKGDYITGKSNHQWRCKCVCGELENEKTMECKRNREGWSTCPDSRPCCTNLDDCKAEDPWPKKVEEQYEKKTAKPKARVKEAKQYVMYLEQMTEVCLTSCRLERSQVYLKELKSVKKKKVFGKDKTWQAAIEKDRFKNKLKTGESNMWKERKRELDNERREFRLEHQLVKLPKGKIMELSGKSCCTCQQTLKSEPQGDFEAASKLLPLPRAMRFCTATSCSAYKAEDESYGSACRSVLPSFCRGDVPECPADLGSFATPVPWE